MDGNAKKKLRHPWLDADDPANAKRIPHYVLPGFWVPTPGEIEFGCELVRSNTVKANGADARRHARPPQQISLSFREKQGEEETQLCDCPYWGTEFQDQ